MYLCKLKVRGARTIQREEKWRTEELLEFCMRYLRQFEDDRGTILKKLELEREGTLLN